jgi:hypothetical protein
VGAGRAGCACDGGHGVNAGRGILQAAIRDTRELSTQHQLQECSGGIIARLLRGRRHQPAAPQYRRSLSARLLCPVARSINGRFTSEADQSAAALL